jgi:hypothetical protein
MVGRAVSNSEPRLPSLPMLPALDGLAPPAPHADLVAQIEARTRPGDAVLDLDGRGGWVARAAIAEQRRAVELETWPLTRLLADVVIRPPDVRQIDLAAHGLTATAFAGSSAKRALGALWASTCPTCGRPVTLDAMVWEVVPGPDSPAGSRSRPRARTRPDVPVLPAMAFRPEESLRPVAREFRCDTCHEKQGGPELRRAEALGSDLTLAESIPSSSPVREALRQRFPAPRPTHPLVDAIVDLHTPRQLVGLHAILTAVEGEERIGSMTATLRLVLLHAVLLASRLNVGHDRPAPIRISGGELTVPNARLWRERNPVAAFGDAVRIVKAFVSYLESGVPRSAMARLGLDLPSIQSGTANVVLAEATRTTLRRLGLQAERIAHSGTPPRVKLMLGQEPLEMTPERLAASYHATGWLFGAAAVAMLPYQELFVAGHRPARPDRTAELARALGRSLAVAAPALAVEGRAVILLDDARPATLVAAALGGAAAGCRLEEARVRRGGEGSGGLAVFVPPTGVMPPGPRTRANRPLPPVVGGAGDPRTVSGRGLFARPERLDEGPFRANVAADAVTETAVDLLKARGEPAPFEDLLGGVLIGLDRCGQLARLASVLRPDKAARGWDAWIGRDDEEGDAAGKAARPAPGPPEAPGDGEAPGPGSKAPGQGNSAASPGGHGAGHATDQLEPADHLLRIILEELDRPNNRRICQVEPGQYWLTANDERSAAQPLADRVEWAVFSLLSSAGRISRRAAVDRTAAQFKAGDDPDVELIEACLDSYTARSGSPDAIVGFDQLETRTIEHDAVIARLADLGHRLGMRVWIGRRQQARSIGGKPLASWLDLDEREVHLPLITWAPEGELERVDCAWYVRRRASFLFEVEWTAMLGEPLLVHHARYPEDDKVVRFLVLPPERARLAALKLARSPLLRNAVAEKNWHFLKWNHLAEWSAAEEPTLEGLEPYLGLEARADKAGEQLPLFGG